MIKKAVAITMLIILAVLAIMIATSDTSSQPVTKNLTIDPVMKTKLAAMNITQVNTSDATPDICQSGCTNDATWAKIDMQVNGYAETRHFSLGMTFSDANKTFTKNNVTVLEAKAQEAINSFLNRTANHDTDTITYAKTYNLK